MLMYTFNLHEGSLKMGRIEVSEPWAGAMIDKGYTDMSGYPVVSVLAKAAGIHPSTLGRNLAGETKPYDRNIIKLARALGRTQGEITEWFEKSTLHGESQTYDPPDVAHLMTARQRKLIDQMIQEFVRQNRREARLRAIPEEEVARGA